jgi:hypothetical protein
MSVTLISMIISLRRARQGRARSRLKERQIRKREGLAPGNRPTAFRISGFFIVSTQLQFCPIDNEATIGK